jgi:hypothetical protein
VFLLQDLPSGATDLLRQLATGGDLAVIAALTGDARADAGVLRAGADAWQRRRSPAVA